MMTTASILSAELQHLADLGFVVQQAIDRLLLGTGTTATESFVDGDNCNNDNSVLHELCLPSSLTTIEVDYLLTMLNGKLNNNNNINNSNSDTAQNRQKFTIQAEWFYPVLRLVIRKATSTKLAISNRQQQQQQHAIKSSSSNGGRQCKGNNKFISSSRSSISSSITFTGSPYSIIGGGGGVNGLSSPTGSNSSSSGSLILVINPCRVRLHLPLMIRDQVLKLSMVKFRRSSPYQRSTVASSSSCSSISSSSIYGYSNSSALSSSSSYITDGGGNTTTTGEVFQSNYNIITYINTEPVPPAKYAPKLTIINCNTTTTIATTPNIECGTEEALAKMTMPHSIGSSAAIITHPMYFNSKFISFHHHQQQQQPTQSSTYNQPQHTFSGGGGTDDQPHPRVHILTGQSKVDKLNLTISLNNQCYLTAQPCRIIYLQSSSILTFWMALTVKNLCGDYHWNQSGYQITLESKSSPNNSIIFFELSTFVRALNRGIDISLVTHLVVDLDQSHFFFNLFLLYLKQNLCDELRHLQVYLLALSDRQAKELYRYFATQNDTTAHVDSGGCYDAGSRQHMVRLVDYATLCGDCENVTTFGVNNPSPNANSLYCSSISRSTEECLVVHYYLEDFPEFVSCSGMLEFEPYFSNQTIGGSGVGGGGGGSGIPFNNTTTTTTIAITPDSTVYNAQMERFMIECWTGKMLITTLVRYIVQQQRQPPPSPSSSSSSSSSSLINYQCQTLNGITPLILAVVRGTIDDCYQLLTLGARCQLTSWNAMEPIEWSIVLRREPIFHLLFVHYCATNEGFELQLQRDYAQRFQFAAIASETLFDKPDMILRTSISATSLVASATDGTGEDGNGGGCDGSGDGGPKLSKTIITATTTTTNQYSVNYALTLRLLAAMIGQIGHQATSTTLVPNGTADDGGTGITGTTCAYYGAILVLLPSYNKISTLRKLIIAQLSHCVEYPFTIFCLYPHLPNNELDIAMNLYATLRSTQVRVILSTFNLDSLLLTDIRFVINTGVLLEKVHSAFCSPVSCSRLVSNQTTIRTTGYCHCSVANSTTATATVGDDHSATKNTASLSSSSPLSKIIFYNLYSKYDVLNQQQLHDSDVMVFDDDNDDNNSQCNNFLLLPTTSDSFASETDSIYHCIFASKCFKFQQQQPQQPHSLRQRHQTRHQKQQQQHSGKNEETIGEMFARMIYQPRPYIVSDTVHFLKKISILDDNERFTDLGKILIDLSIEPHYAKIIIYSVILRCLDPILTIVCALSSPSCFELSDNADQRQIDLQILLTLSNRSYSDHLTLVYAFQKWQELCRSHPTKNGATFDKNGIILFSSFELIYSLRTKILGQLRACGFVKGKGALNIRQLNSNSDNFSLVKAAICAGMSLDHFVVMFNQQQHHHHHHQPSNDLNGVAGGSSAPPIQLLLPSNDDTSSHFGYHHHHHNHRQHQRCFFHPNSILAQHLQQRSKQQQQPPSPQQQQDDNVPNPLNNSTNLVMFDRKIFAGSVCYLEHCTLVSPLTVAIFADEPKPGSIVLRDNVIHIATDYRSASSTSASTTSVNRLEIVVAPDPELTARIFDLRIRWQRYVSKRIQNISSAATISDEEQALISELMRMVTIADELAGLGSTQHQNSIGRAPQVMSTYFCSTKMVVPQQQQRPQQLNQQQPTAMRYSQYHSGVPPPIPPPLPPSPSLLPFHQHQQANYNNATTTATSTTNTTNLQHFQYNTYHFTPNHYHNNNQQQQHSHHNNYR